MQQNDPQLPLPTDATQTVHACADAVRWSPCPNTEQGLHGDHSICQGTGLLFPGLTAQCYRRNSRDYGPGVPHPEECHCKGRGRMLLDGLELEAWLDAAESADSWAWEMSKESSGYYAHVQGNHGFYMAEKKATRVEAIAEAVCRAVGAHV